MSKVKIIPTKLAKDYFIKKLTAKTTSSERFKEILITQQRLFGEMAIFENKILRLYQELGHVHAVADERFIKYQAKVNEARNEINTLAEEAMTLKKELESSSTDLSDIYEF